MDITNNENNYNENNNPKADLHIHSKYSGMTKYLGLTFPDSVEEPKNIAKYASKNGMDIIAVTDHDSLRGGIETKKYEKEYNIKVIVGCEITTIDGELLGLYLNEPIPKHLTVEETIDKIKEQGGLAIAPHPYSPICCALGDKISKLKLDGVEVFNAYHRDGIINNIALKKVVNNYHKNPVAFIGNSDGHIANMIGNGHTIFNGETEEDLYYAIKNRKTTYGGKPTPLSQIILWSYKMMYGYEKAILKSFVYKNKNKNNMTKLEIPFHKKIIAMVGGTIYITTPLPLITGILGNMYLNAKAKNKLKEVEKNSTDF